MFRLISFKVALALSVGATLVASPVKGATACNQPEAEEGVTATRSSLTFPVGVAIDSSGNLLISDSDAQVVRRVTPSGLMTTVAGSGLRGNTGDLGPSTSAALDTPTAVAVDSSGNVFFSEFFGHRVRVVLPTCTISTVAGDGVAGYSGSHGVGVRSSLNFPGGIETDVAGHVYISNSYSHRVQKLIGGALVLVAGSGSRGGYSGDGGPATAAGLNYPEGLAVDSAGNLFIADTSNNRIRKIDLRGVITTVAGSGLNEFSGDGGPATDAGLASPSDVAVDPSGNLFISDRGNHRIRKVGLDGTISTYAGNGTWAYGGDGGPATQGSLSLPKGIALDHDGNLYIADAFNYVVRKVSIDGTITTVAGNGRRLEQPGDRDVRPA